MIRVVAKTLEQDITVVIRGQDGKQGTGHVELGDVMIHDVTPAKLYKINHNRNLIVVEDRDGELHNLIFSNREVLKGRFRGARDKDRTPKYKLKSYYGVENIIACALASLGLGILIGYFFANL